MSYCSRECARADWVHHKLVCGAIKRAHDEGLAVHQAQGGLRQDFNRQNRDTFDSVTARPGFINEVMLLAWKHRHDAPIIYFQDTPGDDVVISDDASGEAK
jgi:hypothetical protein